MAARNVVGRSGPKPGKPEHRGLNPDAIRDLERIRDLVREETEVNALRMRRGTGNRTAPGRFGLRVTPPHVDQFYRAIQQWRLVSNDLMRCGQTKEESQSPDLYLLDTRKSAVPRSG